MSYPTLHLRAESKPLEHRSALTPTTTKALLDAGFDVRVERSKLRVFEDSEYSDIGATLVPEGSWPSAPKDHIIIGLKELAEDTFPLVHTHIQFAHCFKHQSGWAEVLSRFPRGNGTLLDLEFLQDETGRRVAAFGYHAGFAGAALAVQAWAWQLTNPGKPLPAVYSYPNEGLLLNDIRAALKEGEAKAGKLPRALVLGALGRCGKGAVELFQKIGIPDENIMKWDLAETSIKSGPYTEITESDIFLNAIYLSDPIPPFIDAKSLESPHRNLSVVCDVSCDTTNPHNPIPIYRQARPSPSIPPNLTSFTTLNLQNTILTHRFRLSSINTTFSNPTVPVSVSSSPPLSVISIDHLPSLLPREASEAFSTALLPSLLQLKDRKNAKIWRQAEELFYKHVATLPGGMVDG